MTLVENRADEHFFGLDLFQIREASGLIHCAILLEIWKTGALVQLSDPIPAGTCIHITVEGNSIAGVVKHCEQDPYGYLVNIYVDSKDWFPEVYCPEYLLPAQSSHSARVGR